MSAYHYKAIDPETQTRLLRLESKFVDEGSPIVCTLVETTLASPLSYDALSYVWANSISGPLSDIDPDEIGYGWTMSATGTSDITKASIKDLANHRELLPAIRGMGVPRPKGSIILDGVELEVGGELYAALCHLSSLWVAPNGGTGEGKYVWIDALCINQQDVEEKSRQVKKMGDIYKKADTVRIWLGDEASDADRIAFEALYELSDFFSKVYVDEGLTDRVLIQKRFHSDPAMREIRWGCISALLRRNWFSRTWVIQEIAFARKATLHVGKHVCRWELLSEVVWALRESDLDGLLWAETEFTAATTVGLMDHVRRAESGSVGNVESTAQKLTLLEILQQSRAFKCTVAHDKIYGVLNLATDAQKYAEPNYSLEVQDIFADFAKTHLSANDLKILYHCTAKSVEKSALALPSWAPDWTQKCHHTPFYLTKLKCKAAGPTTPYVKVSTLDSVLTTRGRILDTIQHIDHIRNIPRNARQTPKHQGTLPGLETGQPEKFWTGPDFPSRNQENFMDERKANLRNWVDNVMQIAFPSKVILPADFEALWRTFVCNQTTENEIPPSSWGLQFAKFVEGTKRGYDEDEGAWMEGVLRSSSSEGAARHKKWDLTEKFDTVTPFEMGEYMDFVRANGTWCYNRRFFKTAGGRFGWGPDGVGEGDVVAVVDGLDVPLVLRPVDGGYEMVGDCYAYGIMHGEGLVGAESSNVNLL